MQIKNRTSNGMRIPVIFAIKLLPAVIAKGLLSEVDHEGRNTMTREGGRRNNLLFPTAHMVRADLPLYDLILSGYMN